MSRPIESILDAANGRPVIVDGSVEVVFSQEQVELRASRRAYVTVDGRVYEPAPERPDVDPETLGAG